MALTRHEINGLVYFTAPDIPVPHGFSTRLGGVSLPPQDSLDLFPNRGGDTASTLENYRRFYRAIGADETRSVLSVQVHEDTVRAVTEEDIGKGLFRPRDYSADALITNVPGITLQVFSADCSNILLHDRKNGAVGAVHAGWRGCAAGITAKAVCEMVRLYSSSPEDIYAAIGPCIGSCCFETDADVPEAMRAALGSEAEPFLVPRGEKWHVDLAALNRLWLLRAGLSAAHITLSDLCTACDAELFWSHRKMGLNRGLQGAAITCVK